MVSVYRGDRRAGKMTGVRHLLPHRWHLRTLRLQIIVESCCRDGSPYDAPQKVFYKNAQPASARCGLGRVWDFPTSILNWDLKNPIQKSQVGTNLHCLQRMRTPFELQNDFSVAILGLPKFFSGGRRNDRTDNANREQTLPHLR